MSLRKSIIYKLFIFSLNISTLLNDGVWVKYGWELFDYVIDARSASLGNAGIAYNFGSIHSSMTNPARETIYVSRLILNCNVKRVER